ERMTDSLEEAVRWAEEARAAGAVASIGLVGNAAEVYPELLRRGFPADVVTDQTSAHDPLGGYVPAGISPAEAEAMRREPGPREPEAYVRLARESMARHCEAMVGFQRAGSVVFDYGNNLRAGARLGGYDDAFSYPGFVPAYIRPMFCRGRGPFRWVALSGDPEDIYRTDEALLDLFPENEALHRWITMARQMIQFQGLPARICWLGYGERDKAGLAFNELVRKGVVKAPIVIGHDHLDS